MATSLTVNSVNEVITDKGVWVKQSGTWKQAKTIYVKQSGTWKQTKSIYVKQNGVWK